MSELLLRDTPSRESLNLDGGDAGNPLGLDGIEFIEYATAEPQALGQVLERMGFRPVARHRSREVLLYRQGALNLVVNAHPLDALAAAHGSGAPAISAIGLRVRDARAARRYLLEHGGWEVPTHPEAMELNIPAFHGVGGSRLYLVDRWRDFSIYDVDFVPMPGVDPQPPALAGIHFFGLVQYIGHGRTRDWIAFYETLLGATAVPDEQRFGILPAGTLMHVPARDARHAFWLQLVEPAADDFDERELWQRIGLGVPDVQQAMRALRANGVEFMDGRGATERGAVTKGFLGGVVFELVHAPEPAPVQAPVQEPAP